MCEERGGPKEQQQLDRSPLGTIDSIPEKFYKLFLELPKNYTALRIAKKIVLKLRVKMILIFHSEKESLDTFENWHKKVRSMIGN